MANIVLMTRVDCSLNGCVEIVRRLFSFSRSRVGMHKFWQEGVHPELIQDVNMMRQRLIRVIGDLHNMVIRYAFPRRSMGTSDIGPTRALKMFSGIAAYAILQCILNEKVGSGFVFFSRSHAPAWERIRNLNNG